jgi:serine protease
VRKLSILFVLGAFALLFAGTSARADTTSTHHPIYMANVNNTTDPAGGGGSQISNPALQPPPVETGPVCVPDPVGECVLPPPPAGEPDPVNMAYFGGHVQVTPHIYLVLWGWGQPGAFNHTTPGMPTYDPDGAGQRMINFIKAMGGTAWAGSQTQYFETVNGQNINIQNPSNDFGGVWWDNTNPIHNNVSGLELAQEAQRAVAHFGVTDLQNSQFVIAQPQMYNEAGFNSGAGYCAWHDYTQPQFYPGVEPGISFTNMPYVLNSGASCGENAVNKDYFAGRLDGFTIVMGHEIQETITDPGAEDVINGVNLGGWYDYTGYENGDKCAWVGDIQGLTTPSSIPGGLNDITGNDGKQYPVQSLWSNDSAGGAGYCAGAGDDLPVTG